MTDKSSHLPDNSDKNTKENFTPINPADGKKQKKKLGRIALAVVVAFIVSLPIAGYFITKTQPTAPQASQAACPTCHNGTPPLPIDPDCLDGPCTAPREGFCKEKTPTCYECRFSGPGGPYQCEGLRLICLCEAPSPTPPPKLSVCINPNICVDRETALKSGCITATTVDTSSNTCSLPASSTSVGYCCNVLVIPSPSITPKEIPTATPTPTPTKTPTPTPKISETPTPTLACVMPKIEVKVECLQCNGIGGSQ